MKYLNFRPKRDRRSSVLCIRAFARCWLCSWRYIRQSTIPWITQCICSYCRLRRSNHLSLDCFKWIWQRRNLYWIRRKSETINGQTRYYKEPVTKTRIVTDWRPASGTVSKYYFTHFVVDTNHFSKEDRDFRSHIGSNAVRKKKMHYHYGKYTKIKKTENNYM